MPLSPAAVLGVIGDHLAGHPRYSVTDAIVWENRHPRVLLAALVGAALTTAGTDVLVLVRNALADPLLLGVSSGASVGATAVLLFGAFASLGIWAISARHHSERAVHLSGVEEGDAPVDGGADERNALFTGGHGQVALAQAHAAVTDGRDRSAKVIGIPGGLAA